MDSTCVCFGVLNSLQMKAKPGAYGRGSLGVQIPHYFFTFSMSRIVPYIANTVSGYFHLNIDETAHLCIVYVVHHVALFFVCCCANFG